MDGPSSEISPPSDRRASIRMSRAALYRKYSSHEVQGLPSKNIEARWKYIEGNAHSSAWENGVFNPEILPFTGAINGFVLSGDIHTDLNSTRLTFL